LLVLIIGGRYGSKSSTDDNQPSKEEIEKQYQNYNSITKHEYETARAKDIPIFIFVEKNVLAEFRTYQKNRTNKSVDYAHADSVNIFKLLEDILAQRRNNFIKDFENFEDISTWLRDQWAGLFADSLSKRSSDATLRGLAAQISELSQLSSSLKTYSESIIRKIEPDQSEKIIQTEHRRLTRSKASQLFKEGMIRHLIHNYHLEATSLRVFRALTQSKNLEDFLKRLGMNEKHIEKFLNEHKSAAEKDYKQFMERFVKNNDSDETLDPDP
jgi:hypothetical protein